jgi:type IV pilus assembly protein PilB
MECMNMIKVLLVQDNPLLALMWKKTLEKDGFDVHVVNDAKKGLEDAYLETPDIILVDSIMPDLDGFEFCQTIKNIPELKDIPEIILVSNFNLTNEIGRAKELGVDDYWIKYELTPGIILNKVRKLLGQPVEENVITDQAQGIAELLMEAGIITEEQLSSAKKVEREKNITAAEAILQMNILSQEENEYLKELVYRADYVDLDRFVPTREALNLIPDYVAAQYKIMPLMLKGNNLLVAMVNPSELPDIDYLTQITGCTIHTCYAPIEKIEKAIMSAYAGKEFRAEVEKIKQDESEGKKKETFIDGRTLWEVIDERPVVEYVDSVIFRAIEEKASDIHFEPNEEGMIVRFRLDGILHDIYEIPASMSKAVTARLKVMSGMNVVERRVPQDGRFSICVQKKSVDFRLSTVPLIEGEKVVVRILSPDEAAMTLEGLGFSQKLDEIYKKMVSQPYGMVLITGPTGSGKTTTLYGTLRFLNSPEKNVLSIEDPVEYSIKRVNQIQVNVAVNLTFANILRHVLRQDPNVIMVGEIRDIETAELSAQAALTGHMVLGTLHTNDAPSGIIRLIDMGLPPFIVSSTVNGLVAQRLMRRICPSCRKPALLSEEEKKRLPQNLSPVPDRLFAGLGCGHCRNTGYKGRVGIFEMMPVTYSVRRIIATELDLDRITTLARQEGMITLREAAWEKVKAGISTPQEMWRVTQEE